VLGALTEIEVVAIIEKELRRDKVGATRDLGAQILQVMVFIHTFGVHFWISSHPNAEITH
jgi:hypothetical protein